MQRLRRGHAFDQRHELVAAQARDDVAAAHAAGDAATDLAQRLVAHRVAQAVVDQLEAVDVDEQQREAALVALGLRQRMAEALGEEGAVEEPGHLVARRHRLDRADRVLQLLLALAQAIAQLADATADHREPGQREREQRPVEPFLLHVLDRLRPPVHQQIDHQGVGGQRVQRQGHQLAGAQPENPEQENQKAQAERDAAADVDRVQPDHQ